MWEKFFRSNKFALAIAIFLAIILWLFVSGNDVSGPEAEVREFDVSLAPRALEDRLEVAEMPSKVRLELEGSKEDLRYIEPDMLYAYVDLENREEPGTFKLPVELDLPENLDLVSCSHSKVEVVLDEVVSRSLEVEVAYLGERWDEELEVKIDPRQVTLEGAESRVDKVDKVIIKVDMDRIEEFMGEELYLKPRPLDENKNIMEDLLLTPGVVEARLL